jgi:hypothetical protein
MKETSEEIAFNVQRLLRQLKILTLWLADEPAAKAIGKCQQCVFSRGRYWHLWKR